MGIDRLYAWIKYRAWGILSEQVLLKELPKDFKLQHLYIDFYNIIHESRDEIEKLPVEEKDPLRFLSNEELEEILIVRIMEKLRNLIEKANPNKSITICIDGVTNLQKINAKRHNSHLSFFYNYTLKNRKRDEIIENPNERLFHCTTFGIASPFIIKLESRLGELFKCSSLEVIIDNSINPGEGEHKIISHIRTRKIPNDETIAIHGSDADLIVLAMLLQHNNVYIYRNDVEKIIVEQEIQSTDSDLSGDESHSIDESNGEDSETDKKELSEKEIRIKYQVFINIRALGEELARWMNNIIIPNEKEKMLDINELQINEIETNNFIEDFVFLTFFPRE